VQGIRVTATLGAIANGQRSSKNDTDDCKELEGGVMRKNLFDQHYKKRVPRGWQGHREFAQASRIFLV
jgi:hypothetical protein